ncbi:MAG: tripartite tricarboxylate transporter substrate-binding protein [Pseudomonadota bacterium]|nr:tripartite tricarboxylate transporter substrate-binding protein [Pseudomonadota bacterium]
MQRRFLVHACAALVASSALTAVAGVHAAQAPSRSAARFPSRPIRLVIAFPAGGPTDASVRTLAANAAHILGQPVIVDNRPGAGGSLPLEQMHTALADGYTLAQIPVSVFRPPSRDAKSHEAVGQELVPVINVTGYALGMVLSPDSPLMGWTNFVAWARAGLGRLAYGPGSPPLSLELMAEKLRLRLRVQQQLLQGNASRSGTPLAWRGDEDTGSQEAFSAGLPTLKDLGLGLIQNEPFGIAAPRGTPPAVVQRLHDAFKKAMAQDNFKRTLRD